MRLRIATSVTGFLVAAAATAFAGAAHAATIAFETDPFAGSTALSTPGRQVVGGEPFFVFDPAVDQILIDPVVFGVTPPLVAFSGLTTGLTNGFNVIAVGDLDADAVLAGNQMNAGLAANLIADAVTDPGAGFFFYFNSGLNLVRFVYSTDLSDNTADLKVLARFTNLSGTTGEQALARLGPQVGVVPEPNVWALMVAGFGLAGAALRRGRWMVRHGV